MTEEILDVRKLLSKSDQAPEKSTLIETDLGNLIAFDYQDYPKGFDIAAVTYVFLFFLHNLIIRQNALQELYVQLFQLPIKQDEDTMGIKFLQIFFFFYLLDPLAELPAGTMPIPREKSPPEPKPLTKWEEFAKKKGIKKKKKSRLVWT